MIKNLKKQNILKNKNGVALFEMLPLLIVFVALVGLTVGLWGAVHSGILQSIAARHYAFEVINNRTHFEYHRDFDQTTLSSSNGLMYNNSNFANAESDFFGNVGARLFAITADSVSVYSTSAQITPYVTHRGINFFEEIKRDYNQNPKGVIPAQERTLGASFHNQQSFSSDDVETVNPLWLMTGYGICLDADCAE